MASDNDAIENVKKELTELKKLGGMTDQQFIAAISYINSNHEEVVESVWISSVSDAADLVLDVVRVSCRGGRC